MRTHLRQRGAIRVVVAAAALTLAGTACQPPPLPLKPVAKPAAKPVVTVPPKAAVKPVVTVPPTAAVKPVVTVPPKSAVKPVVTVPPTAVVTPPPLAKVVCPGSGTITVNTSIVWQVQALVNDAKAQGLTLCGGGYRSAASQIATRMANCGTTAYEIYDKPANQCSPPTANPGRSMHEKGLAIDWNSCTNRTTACFTWLTKHASTYGLKNLPSEPWHWSTTGG
jgi:hypothetical protein